MSKDQRSEREKMVAGDPYRPGDPELVAARAKAQQLMAAYNATTVADGHTRAPLLKALLGSYGRSPAIRTPFYVDYGTNIHLGDDVFFNYGCTVLDICPVTIGDRTQIGPMTQLLAADHPRDAESRAAFLELGKPITIGADVWIGGGALILPGVSIGDGAIVGAGAVVTRDVAPGQTVAGNSARPLG
ncbi:MAG: sugar O-acetyltransferase [Pseudomonadota bacterium]